MSKIQSESKSQHLSKRRHRSRVVLSMSKIQSESKSQRRKDDKARPGSCVIYVKDTIWKQITTHKVLIKQNILLCYLCQRYNLKANHNSFCLFKIKGFVVLSMSKIQSESKSQLPPICIVSAASCVIYVKDTIWKQITTKKLDGSASDLLCYLCQRYNLKANHNW